MAITYTDIKNVQAQSDALESVNDYLDKRRQSRSSMKQAEVKPKQIEKWTDKEGNVHITTGIQGKDGEFYNINRQIVEGAGEKEVADDPKTIEGARQLAAMYGRTEEFEPRFQAYEATKNVDGTVNQAFIDDMYRDITANVKKDDKAKPLTIDGLRTGMGLYTNLPDTFKARLDEIEGQVKAGTANINSQEVQASLKDFQKDYQNWSEKAKTEPKTWNYDALEMIVENDLTGENQTKGRQLLRIINENPIDSNITNKMAQAITTLATMGPKTGTSTTEEWNAEEVKKAYESTLTGENLDKANRLYTSMEKTKDTKIKQKRLQQIMALVPDTSVKEEIEKIPKMGSRDKLALGYMMSVSHIDNPLFGEMAMAGSTDYNITDRMQTAFRRYQRAVIAEDAAKDNIKYTGQVVHNAEQIVLTKDLAESQLFKEFEKDPNIVKASNEIIKNFSDEKTRNAEMKKLLFNWVQEKKNKFEDDGFYYTLHVSLPAGKHDFNRFYRKSIGEELQSLGN